MTSVGSVPAGGPSTRARSGAGAGAAPASAVAVAAAAGFTFARPYIPGHATTPAGSDAFNELRRRAEEVLGGRFSRTKEAAAADYERAQRALFGVSKDEDALQDAKLAHRGPWSDAIKREVQFHISRLHRSPGFKHYKVPAMDMSTLVFLPVATSTTSAASAVPTATTTAKGKGNPLPPPPPGSLPLHSAPDMTQLQADFQAITAANQAEMTALKQQLAAVTQQSMLQDQNFRSMAELMKDNSDMLKRLAESTAQQNNAPQATPQQQQQQPQQNAPAGTALGTNKRSAIPLDATAEDILKRQRLEGAKELDASFQQVAGAGSATGSTKSVDDLLSELFPADTSTSAPPPGSSGVPSQKTAADVQAMQEPPAPVINSDILQRQVLEFVGKANAAAASAGTGAAAVKKRAVTELLAKLDEMSPAELASMQGSGSWIQSLLPDPNKSSGASYTSCTAAPRPVCRVKPGRMYTPYHFIPRKVSTTGDVLSSIFAPDFDEDDDSADTTGSLSAAELKRNFQAISSIADVISCAGRLVEFARCHQATRTVKHLHAAGHFVAHQQYLDRLLDFSKVYKLEYVMRYDVEFRRLVHQQGHRFVDPWSMPDQKIFQSTFEIPGPAARLGKKNNDRDDTDGTRKKKTQSKGKYNFAKFTNKTAPCGGKYCYNFNLGRCGKPDDGKECPNKRVHRCIKCNATDHCYKGSGCDT
eukprot:SAG31_NODE_5151_length_2712_cov_63.283965_2_plen_701_part_00